jgi:hypothetical protein
VRGGGGGGRGGGERTLPRLVFGRTSGSSCSSLGEGIGGRGGDDGEVDFCLSYCENMAELVCVDGGEDNDRGATIIGSV